MLELGITGGARTTNGGAVMSRGRPSKYDPKTHPRIAKAMCALGATVPDLAQAFGVAESTVKLWATQHADFSDALRIGREPADEKVERALFERAVGYSHDEDDIRVIENQIVITPTTKHYPPDTKAALAWLYNRRSDRWHPEAGKGDGESESDRLAAALESLVDRLPGA